jgi:glutathione S-transferase
MLMLERKGIPYKRVDLIPVISKGVVRIQRFPGVTVPALKLAGRRFQGSREIARELDRIQPDPPLFPADQEARAKVEVAETWGDEFQQQPRRFVWWALKRDRAPMASYLEEARLGVPVGLAVKTGGPIVSLSARFNGSTDENVRMDLASLRGDLDRLDA